MAVWLAGRLGWLGWPNWAGWPRWVAGWLGGWLAGWLGGWLAGKPVSLIARGPERAISTYAHEIRICNRDDDTDRSWNYIQTSTSMFMVVLLGHGRLAKLKKSKLDP